MGQKAIDDGIGCGLDLKTRKGWITEVMILLAGLLETIVAIRCEYIEVIFGGDWMQLAPEKILKLVCDDMIIIPNS